MMKKRLVLTALVLAVVLTTGSLLAQEPAPFITVHYDTIDPSMTMAFEENGKAWAGAYQEAKAGEDYYWRAYKSGFTYAWVSDMPNYAYLDDMDASFKAIAEKIGEEKMHELESGAEGAITDHFTEIWKYQADMSYAPAGFDTSGMTAISVSLDTIKSGKGKEYRELVKEVIAAMKSIEAPVNFFAYTIPFGRGGYGWVMFGEDRADLHSGPQFGELLAKAVGPEKAKEYYAKFMNCIATTEDRDWNIRADLAYSGASAMADKAMEKAAE